MIKRCLSRRSTLAGWGLGVVVAVAALLFAAPAPAATPPTIDGNLTDMITFVNQVIAEKIGNGLTKADPAKDVCKSDASIFPCPAGNEEPCPTDPVNRTYFKNGYDLILAVAAYDQSTQTLYLGTRAAGVIGDVDGDQTAGDGGCAPPPGKLDINDGNGIGNNETYIFNVDFDCGQNGVNELRIEVDNGTLFVNDVAQDPANWAFNGSDLEIKIAGQVLPAMWSISVKTGASEDGLEEETIQERTPPPPLDLTIVKSAEPTVICPNGNTVFTVTVTNTGAAALDVNLVDALPAQLSFVSLDPSSDFVLNPNPPATPQNLVFATLNMAPGAVRIAKFTAQASAECFGAVENVATVTGVFTAACLPPPGTATVGPLEARATVVCKAQPCVDNVQCEVPQAVCVDETYTVTGKARNCSPDPEDITITIKTGAGAVVKTQKFTGVAPGATATLVSDPITCTTPGVNDYVIEAQAENECGATDVVTSNCSVTCKSAPCVDRVQCSIEPPSPGFGGTYTVSGTACNCGDRPADLTITIKDGSGAVIKTQVYEAVPAGECRTLTSDPLTCSGLHNYTIEAQAANDCGTTAVVPSTCSVECEESLCCWLTMGGFLNADMRSGNKDNTYGGNVGPPPSGSWQHIQRNGKEEVFNFHSHDAHVIACGNDGTAGPCHPAGDANWINFGGTGYYSISGGPRIYGATFRARAEDHGEPGREGWQKGGCGTPDFYRIEVFDQSGALVFTVEGYVDGGNIQIHDCKHAKETSSGRSGSSNGRLKSMGDGETSTETASVGTSLELYRPTPNPFTATTAIAYAINAGEGADVQIGVYNVAGRLVRSLVSGFQSAGRYQVSWDGRSDDGTAVTHGVYFLRAFVGGQRIDAVSRILYLR